MQAYYTHDESIEKRYSAREQGRMVTARADFDDKELFLNTFRKYKIDMNKVHVYRAGNMKGGSLKRTKKVLFVL